MGEPVPIYYSIVAFFCTGGAIALAVLHIYKHLLNYTEPTYQRLIVRIIFMVPVSGSMAMISLPLIINIINVHNLISVEGKLPSLELLEPRTRFYPVHHPLYRAQKWELLKLSDRNLYVLEALSIKFGHA